MTAITLCDEEVELIMLVAVRDCWNKGLPPMFDICEKKELVDYYNSASTMVFNEVNKTLEEDMDIVLAFIEQFQSDGYFGVTVGDVPWKAISNAGRGRVRDLQDAIFEEGLRLLRLVQSTSSDPFVTKADTHSVGVAGIRDTDNECTVFEPGNPGGGVKPPTCQGDGHYLCQSCCNYIQEESQ